jgi:hypothetical protein
MTQCEDGFPARPGEFGRADRGKRQFVGRRMRVAASLERSGGTHAQRIKKSTSGYARLAKAIEGGDLAADGKTQSSLLRSDLRQRPPMFR